MQYTTKRAQVVLANYFQHSDDGLHRAHCWNLEMRFSLSLKGHARLRRLAAAVLH